MEQGLQYSASFFERSLPDPLFLIVDANTAVCLVIEEEMLLNENENNNDGGTYQGGQGEGDQFRKVCDQLIRLSMSFTTLWVVLDCKNRSTNSQNSGGACDTMPGSIAASNVQLMLRMQKWFIQMQASLNCTFLLRFTCSTSSNGLNNMVDILTEVIEETAASKCTAAAAAAATTTDPNGLTELQQWLDRDFLGEIESDKERFLSLAVPGMNCFKAQQLLEQVSFIECLGWYSETVLAVRARHPMIDSGTIECVRYALAPPG